MVGLVAGQHPLRAHAVAGVGVVRRADDGELVHDLGLLRQVLADLDAGHVGGDRLELAAELGRGVRLEIVHVDVAGPAGLPDQDDRLAVRWRCPVRPEPEQARQRQAAEGERADLEEASGGAG